MLGKAAIAAQRAERLVYRNPDRLQRQVDDLKALEQSSGGKLSARDRKQLEELERDIGRVRKAREAAKSKGIDLRGPGSDNRDGGRRGSKRDDRRDGRGSILGKRQRETNEPESSETDEDVRNIPMPRDTPPPIPTQRFRHTPGERTNPNLEPLGEGRVGGEREFHVLPAKPEPPLVIAQTVYEAKPAVGDLRREAVSKFVPAIVQQKLKAKRGYAPGKLLEEDEMEKLEREGYGAPIKKDNVKRELGDELDRKDEEQRKLMQEEENFERELRMAQMEEDAGVQKESRLLSLQEDLGLIRFGKPVALEEVSDVDL